MLIFSSLVCETQKGIDVKMSQNSKPLEKFTSGEEKKSVKLGEKSSSTLLMLEFKERKNHETLRVKRMRKNTITCVCVARDLETTRPTT